ncbi:hypothetical protein NUW54_g14302 [Trametes sanguinea]|uniref:Uncharacterized protein n=1 Tax=Trametes sanguinea TaxID=158606 RepID=A0ACC1ME33_9APHY|nr:hypothetical protein NUW54_g14302 [Trametes sanguinea]
MDVATDAAQSEREIEETEEVMEEMLLSEDFAEQLGIGVNGGGTCSAGDDEGSRHLDGDEGHRRVRPGVVIIGRATPTHRAVRPELALKHLPLMVCGGALQHQPIRQARPGLAARPPPGPPSPPIVPLWRPALAHRRPTPTPSTSPGVESIRPSSHLGGNEHKLPVHGCSRSEHLRSPRALHSVPGCGRRSLTN